MDYNKLQVIDFLIKGNTIKLALGCPDKNGDWTNHDWSAEWTSYRPEASTSYYGDDWDDCPYEYIKIYFGDTVETVMNNLKGHVLAVE